MTEKIFFTVSVLLALLIPSMLQPPGGTAMAMNNEGIVFSYKFPENRTLKYMIIVKGAVEIDSGMGVQTNPIHIEMEVHQHTRKTDGKSAELELEVVLARIFEGTRSAPLPEEGDKSIMTIDERGNLTFIRGTGDFKGQEFAQMIFPEKPIQPGDSWYQKTESKLGSDVETRTKYTYSGMTRHGAHLCAKFDAEMVLAGRQSAQHEPNAKSKGETLFSVELGAVVRTVADSRFTFQMPFPEDPSITIKSTTTLRTEMVLID